jgi:hypothetical protein
MRVRLLLVIGLLTEQTGLGCVSILSLLPFVPAIPLLLHCFITIANPITRSLSLRNCDLYCM